MKLTIPDLLVAMIGVFESGKSTVVRALLRIRPGGIFSA
jgi:hypothetical protein